MALRTNNHRAILGADPPFMHPFPLLLVTHGSLSKQSFSPSFPFPVLKITV